MTDLERTLRRLGEELAFPETPDVSGAVRRRLAAERPGGRPLGRRALVLAFAVLAVAVGAAMAVPAARTAILELFRLRGATVERVETLPVVPQVPAPTASALLLGEPVPIEDGRPLVQIPEVLVPAALGPPDAAYVSRGVPRKLSLVYEPGGGVPRSHYTGVGVLVTQFDGDLDTETYVDKLAAGGTKVEQVTVNGSPGIWLEGGPHYVLFRTPQGDFVEDEARLAGNTLLFEHGSILVRIEGEIDRARALEIAESVERR